MPGIAWNRSCWTTTSAFAPATCRWPLMSRSAGSSWTPCPGSSKSRPKSRPALASRLGLRWKEKGERMKLIMSIVPQRRCRAVGECVDRVRLPGHHHSARPGLLSARGTRRSLSEPEDENVDHVLQLVQENCRTRRQFVNPLPPVMEPGEMYMPTPVEVQLGGATVFVLDVNRFEQF